MHSQDVCGVFIGCCAVGPCHSSCYANLKLKIASWVHWLYPYIVQMSKLYHRKTKSVVGGQFAN